MINISRNEGGECYLQTLLTPLIEANVTSSHKETIDIKCEGSYLPIPRGFWSMVMFNFSVLCLV